jgi:hypothetical protein
MGILSSAVDRLLHTTAIKAANSQASAALELHGQTPVVDLLVGSALFRPEISAAGGRGHVDLDRLRAGGVKVIGLTVATRYPDLRGSLSRFHFGSLGAPRTALRSNMALAEWLIGRIHAWCEARPAELRLLKDTGDLEDCLAPGGPISFRYISYHSVFAATYPGAVIQVNGATVSRLEQFFPPGASIELSVDSIQFDQTGRSRYDFLAWSDGGSRAHSLVAGEEPDTVTAQLAVAHRLRVGVQGAPMAAIMSGIDGDLSAGVYLNEGNQVSLQAAPQPGAVFAGWSGDTTSTRDTLTLLLQHPFDLLANFVAVQDVTIDTAADALFGTSMLESDEASYLDAVGNRNAVYDLGDFLATLDRSGS